MTEKITMYRYRMNAPKGVVPAGALVAISDDLARDRKQRLEGTDDPGVYLAINPLTFRQGDEFECNINLKATLPGLTLLPNETKRRVASGTAAKNRKRQPIIEG